MCAELLFVIPVCETKKYVLKTATFCVWLVENGDRMGPVDGSVDRRVEKLIGAPVQRRSNSISKIVQRRNFTPYCCVCRFVWSTTITMLSVTNSCEIISLCLWINTDLLIKSWIAMKITSIQPKSWIAMKITSIQPFTFSFSLCFTPLPCPIPWLTLLPCAPIPLPPPSPTMGNTPAMCTYPLPPPYHG